MHKTFLCDYQLVLNIQEFPDDVFEGYEVIIS